MIFMRFDPAPWFAQAVGVAIAISDLARLMTTAVAFGTFNEVEWGSHSIATAR
jgi:hypothetical protein